MALKKTLLLSVAVFGVINLTLCLRFIDAQAVNNHDLKFLKSDLSLFNTYEVMHDDAAKRVQRDLRQLEKPTDEHNEQPSQELLLKRHIKNRSLPSEPRMLKFEISDAVEPSDDVKQLIKKHRSRELILEKTTTPKPKKTTSSNRNVMRLASTTNKHKSSRSGRNKRTAMRKPSTQFQVHLIPFEESDAREPSEESKKLIKRMRALELEQLHQIQATTKSTMPPFPKPQNTPPTVEPLSAKEETTSPSVSLLSSRPKTRKFLMKSLRKRTRRSASQQQRSAPQMFKFELEDAKDPDESMKSLIKAQNFPRQSREMKSNETRSERKSDMASEDQSNEESKRFFFYKEAPRKTKKSVNSLPQQVQKAITHMLKDNQGAKAQIKYLPAQKMDYNRLRSIAYGAKAVGSLLQGQKGIHLPPAYVKYVAAPQQQLHHVQIHPVPVVEKFQYVYKAAHNYDTPAQAPALQHYGPVQHEPVQQQLVAHPIIMPESNYAKQVPAMITEVHHTYSVDLAHAQQAIEAEEATKQSNGEEFLALKPDPFYDDNKMGVDKVAAAAKSEAEVPQKQEQPKSAAIVHNYVPVENYKYELYNGQVHQPDPSEHPAEATPLIKIEYHATPDVVKQNYKDLAEFKELSALMGKSPEDQFHGLTYLIAKEMQAKRQQLRQQKILADEAMIAHSAQSRPQDNTSPILFHPPGEEQKPVASNSQPSEHNANSVRLIGMGKSKQYIPIVEQVAPKADTGGQSYEHQQQQNQIQAAPVENKSYADQHSLKLPAPSSFVQYDLSPNYETGMKNQQNTMKLEGPQVIQHASIMHHGIDGSGGANKVVKLYGGGDTASHNAGIDIELKQSEGTDGIIKHGKTLLFRTKIDEREAMQYASKYAFGYRIRDFGTGNDFGHKQNRDLDGVTRGQYHILLPDGRIQNVIYHADETGFHADVSFETGH